MHAIPRVIVILFSLVALAGCGGSQRLLTAGQSYALAPDLTVRLVSSRPALSQLRLQLTVLPTGATSLETLVRSVVVIPSGGQETSASLDFDRESALITMLLNSAEHVVSVTVRDARSGQSAAWNVPHTQPVLGCSGSDQCQLIGVPNGQALPSRP